MRNYSNIISNNSHWMSNTHHSTNCPHYGTNANDQQHYLPIIVHKPDLETSSP